MKKYLISLTLINVSSLGFGVVLGLFCFYYFKLFIKKNISFVYHSLFFFLPLILLHVKKKEKFNCLSEGKKAYLGLPSCAGFCFVFLFCFCGGFVLVFYSFKIFC